MKMIMGTLVAAGVLLGAARAEFDPFGEGQALPRSEQISSDDYRQALPRTSNDAHRDALPFADEIFPDIVIAKP
jgi:hypothetical protein